MIVLTSNLVQGTGPRTGIIDSAWVNDRGLLIVTWHTLNPSLDPSINFLLQNTNGSRSTTLTNRSAPAQLDLSGMTGDDYMFLRPVYYSGGSVDPNTENTTFMAGVPMLPVAVDFTGELVLTPNAAAVGQDVTFTVNPTTPGGGGGGVVVG